MVVARGAHVHCPEPLSSAARFRLQSGIRGGRLLTRLLHFLMLEQEGGHFDFPSHLPSQPTNRRHDALGWQIDRIE
jgi:hypothetical protein